MVLTLYKFLQHQKEGFWEENVRFTYILIEFHQLSLQLDNKGSISGLTISKYSLVLENVTLNKYTGRNNRKSISLNQPTQLVKLQGRYAILRIINYCYSS